MTGEFEPASAPPSPSPVELQRAGPYRPVSAWSAPAAILITLAIIAVSIGGASLALDAVRRRATSEGHAAMMLMAMSQIIMIALTIAAARHRNTRLTDAFALRPPAHGVSDYVLGLALMVVTLTAVNVIAILVLGHDPLTDLRPFSGIFKGSAWLLALAVVGIGAPVSEELLFRGFLQAALTRSKLGFAGAAAVSIVLWAALHAGYSIIGLIEVVLIGVVFSFLLWRTGSLRVSLVCHALYNTALALFTRYIMP